MTPVWLHVVATASLIIGFLCAIWIAVDIARHPQHMWIMNVVWPVTALFGHVLALLGYYMYGRIAADEVADPAIKRGETPPHKRRIPFAAKVAKGASHCGSGCTIGDIVSEWLLFLYPALAIWFGWKTVFSDRIFAIWIVDYLCAFGFGIAFQYFTIKPMRNLSVGQGLVQAVKADAISLTAWQVGMYGFMAFAQFYIFEPVLRVSLHTNSVEFWFMMQLAMLCGFVTAYPVNWFLIRIGIKEAM